LPSFCQQKTSFSKKASGSDEIIGARPDRECQRCP